MKRFHVHIHVEDLTASIAFYSRLFKAAPTRAESDYAKWMIEDPRVNFAISTRAGTPGLDHLGIQVDTEDELAQLKADAEEAEMALLNEGDTTCCYARSDKHWITDPQGIAWEHFHTLANIPVFREATREATTEAPTAQANACCAPSAAANATACCAPAPTAAASCAPTGRKSSCC